MILTLGAPPPLSRLSIPQTCWLQVCFYRKEWVIRGGKRMKGENKKTKKENTSKGDQSMSWEEHSLCPVFVIELFRESQ